VGGLTIFRASYHLGWHNRMVHAVGLAVMTCLAGCTSHNSPEARIRDWRGNAVPDCSTPPIDDTRTWTRPASSGVPPDPGPQSAGACNPLQSRYVPIELEPPIAVGREEDGTLYVVDRVGGDSRSFAGTEGVLRRGTDAHSTQSDRAFLWSYFSAGGQWGLLRIDRDAWQAGRLGPQHFSMARLGEVDRDATAPQHMCQGGLLEILSPEAAEGWAVRNREEEISVEYVVEAPDDRLLLVTSANHLSTLRVFFGPKHKVDERELTTFARARDGGTTDVHFIVDGERAHAHFPIRCDGSESPHSSTTKREPLRRSEGCPGTLTIGDEALILPPSPFPATRAHVPPATFVCMRRANAPGVQAAK
jgi:hypothetical protein